MATGKMSFDKHDEKQSQFLYIGKITGINPTAQINPYVNNTKFAVTAFNPDIEKTSDESIFDLAKLKQMDVMEDFSKWLLSNGWEFHYSKKIWINHENSNQYLFSEVYQMFLESIKE